MKTIALSVLGLLLVSGPAFADPDPISSSHYSSDGTRGTSILSAYSDANWKAEIPVVQTEAAAFIASRGRSRLGATTLKYVVEARRAYPHLTDLQITALILASTVE